MNEFKLCFFLQSLIVGGAEKFHVRLANYLVGQGYRVTIIVVRPGGALRQMLDDRVDVISLNYTGEKWLSLPMLVSTLRNLEPTSILSACTEPNLMLLVSRVFLSRKAKIVINVRSNFSQSQKHANRVSRRQVVFGLAVRKLYPTADAIITISDGVREDLCRTLGDGIRCRTVTINNNVDTSLPQMDSTLLVERKKISGAKLIVACGTLKHAKGFDVLLRAFAQASKNCRQETALWIVGEGPLRDSLISLSNSLNISDRVWFIGYHPEPKCALMLADLFVLSSRYEGMPNVILEALSVDLPVVSTDCESGPREILSGGEYGRLVPVDDAYAMSKAIVEALESKTESGVLVSRAKQFTIDRIAARYVDVLASG